VVRLIHPAGNEFRLQRRLESRSFCASCAFLWPLHLSPMAKSRSVPAEAHGRTPNHAARRVPPLARLLILSPIPPSRFHFRLTWIRAGENDSETDRSRVETVRIAS